jgi:lysozyme family protein
MGAVAHACNPDYLEGWDQEDQILRSAQENSSQDSFFKITKAKWTGSVAEVVESTKTWVQTPVPTKKDREGEREEM